MVTFDKKSDFICKYTEIKNMSESIKIAKLDESEKTTMSIEVARKIYELASQKLPSIDFGDIPLSKGDLTRFTHYTTMTDALAILEEAFGSTQVQDIQTVRQAINNLIANKDHFTKAYVDGISGPVYLYQLTVMACLQSISLMISSYLNYVKNPDGNFTVELAISTTKKIKSMDTLCINSLETFNQFCLQNGVKHMVYGSKELLGTSIALSGVIGVGVVAVLMILIIPVMRELIYQFYYSRTSISQYIDTQINLINLHNSVDHVDKKVSKRQEKVVSVLKKISDVIKVDVKSADSKATKEISTEKIKVQTEPAAFGTPGVDGTQSFSV